MRRNGILVQVRDYSANKTANKMDESKREVANHSNEYQQSERRSAYRPQL